MGETMVYCKAENEMQQHSNSTFDNASQIQYNEGSKAIG